ncbi:procyclic acidic repetitive family protein [Frankia sp. CiP3]|uniref:procyclic acidic repetitive family protein n=1 Tax=Frankia sp. CiP3 TaxID=2880971 RepID=UPI001EF6D773|nr:procyclic acidic repetitive family protein [Frankia sp. CiP3]
MSAGEAPDSEAADQRLVRLLAGAPGLSGRPGRQRLQERIALRLGPDRRLYLTEYDVEYLWFGALVEELAAETGGLTALSRAVTDLLPGSRQALAVARLVSTLLGDGRDGGRGGREPEPEVPCSPSRLPEPSPVAVPGPEPEPELALRTAEIRELALAFGRDVEASLLLEAAGVPVERIPTGGVDAVTFWAEVSRLFVRGLVADGRRRVLAAASARFPANPVFASGRGR